MPMLEAQGLCKSYGSRAVVADLSLSVAAGEIVGLLGPNGAGKSTTVAMLCGLVGADQGRVFVGDGASRIALTENTPDAKRRIGVVPQELSIYENLGAAANLELFGALYGLAGTLLRERVDAALTLVGLADRAKDKPSTFSGVDPQSRNAIFDNLESLRERGKALLDTTHYMEEAERLCDRVVIMDHGRVVASDRLQGLYKRLPVVETLAIEVDGTVDLAALASEPGIARPAQDGTRLTAGVADLGRTAPALLSWLAAHGHTVHRISSGRADLEDVFLSLTGRQLRD